MRRIPRSRASWGLGSSPSCAVSLTAGGRNLYAGTDLRLEGLPLKRRKGSLGPLLLQGRRLLLLQEPRQRHQGQEADYRPCHRRAPLSRTLPPGRPAPRHPRPGHGRDHRSRRGGWDLQGEEPACRPLRVWRQGSTGLAGCRPLVAVQTPPPGPDRPFPPLRASLQERPPWH